MDDIADRLEKAVAKAGITEQNVEGTTFLIRDGVPVVCFLEREGYTAAMQSFTEADESVLWELDFWENTEELAGLVWLVNFCSDDFPDGKEIIKAGRIVDMEEGNADHATKALNVPKLGDTFSDFFVDGLVQEATRLASHLKTE